MPKIWPFGFPFLSASMVIQFKLDNIRYWPLYIHLTCRLLKSFSFAKDSNGQLQWMGLNFAVKGSSALYSCQDRHFAEPESEVISRDGSDFM